MPITGTTVTTDTSGFRIDPAIPGTPSQEALRLVFREFPAEARQRYVESMAAELADAAWPGGRLLEARRDGRLAGAALGLCQAGRTAVVWPPQTAPGEPEDTAVQLLLAISDWLAAQGAQAAHVLLPDGSQVHDFLWQRTGYQRLAELLYLGSLREDFPVQPPEGALGYEAYRPASHDRLIRVVESTYRDTLDCPQLNGVRSTEDVLAGYRSTGSFDPDRWLIVREAENDVGCLLLADHPGDGTWEIVYMGLVPAARGHGRGGEIARRAQWMAGQAGRARLVVGVDAANAPAVGMSLAAGFRQWDRRIVYWKRL
jgi:RimJ/RimL family protein N-acetyltransferase